MNRILKATLPLLLIGALCLSADVFALGARGGGGMRGGGNVGNGNGNGGNGGKGNNNNNNNNNPDDKKNNDFIWRSSISDAIGSAKTNDAPIMAVLRRQGNLDDAKVVEKIASWPQAVELSKESMAAVRVSVDSPEGKALMTRLRLKNVPSVAWLDEYGNGILGSGVPESSAGIAAIVNGWKNTMAGIDKFFKDHVARGERYLGQGRLREAYIELSVAAPFKGPLPEQSKAGLDKVKERWTQLLDLAAAMPAESLGRAAVIKGLRRDVQGLDFAAVLETAIQKGGNAVADSKDSGAAKAPAVASTEDKPLSELINTRVATSDQAQEDGQLDFRCLTGKTDDRFKQAETLLKEALVDYKKATDEKMERGPARNELLKNAHTKFDKTLTLLDAASAGKPDGGVEKLMEKTSMLMYASLKYQSL